MVFGKATELTLKLVQKESYPTICEISFGKGNYFDVILAVLQLT